MIIRGTICLHTFLDQTISTGYCPTGFVDTCDGTGNMKEGEWRHIVANHGNGGRLLNEIVPVRGSCRPISAVDVRNLMKQHVNSFQGSVPWQWNHVRSRGDIIHYSNILLD